MESLFYISILLLISSCNSAIFHILDTSTTDDPPVCKRPHSTTTGTYRNTEYPILELVHRDGACARPNDLDQNQEVYTTAKLAEILRRDQLRIKSLRSPHCSTDKNMPSLNLSLQSDQSGEYIIRLGFGTPNTQYVHLIMDTGSDVTWTQCQPCARHCYKQRDNIFNPLNSASYSNISCKDQRCPSPDGWSFDCYRNRTCVYLVFYADESHTVGFLGKDTLNLYLTGGGSRAVFQNFIFGCGQNNNLTAGLEDAGVLGLSRHPLSLISQIAPSNGNRQFSYCIPTSIHSAGYLTLGKNNSNNVDVRFTPFTTCPIGSDSLYCIEIISITIGNSKLHIKQSSVFKNHTIIDSGTTLTYLPQAAYNAMRKEFNRQMDKNKYPLLPAGHDPICDTCYNTSKHKKNITHPLVSFTFKGNVTVNIDPHGTLIRADSAVVCLAFAANPDVSMFGNLAQMTHEVVYDISGNQLGFSPSSCA